MKEQKKINCTIIIVTHNSQPYLTHCINSIKKQTYQPNKIIIVDSASQQTDYLLLYQQDPQIQLCLMQNNVGFCQGNNIGMAHVCPHTEYVLFLNPDAFLTPLFIEQAVQYMELPSSKNIGALSGLLLGYSIQHNQPTGQLDSAGIFQHWSGRWYDRGQGEKYHLEHYAKPEQVPALCGALMFCRRIALEQVMLGPNQVMDPSFYMYKEDIDLSLRLRHKGWSLVFMPYFKAYHCRGWQKDRTKVPRHLRLLSAKNEILLHAKCSSPYILYSVLKYLLVKTFNV